MNIENRTAKFSLIARLRSFRYALDGFQFLLQTQHNAWVHSLATLLIIGCGFALEIVNSDWIALIVAITLVWAGEAMNTAFEHLCDVISPHHNMSVKRAKDIAATSVLICAFGATAIGALTLLPYVFEMF